MRTRTILPALGLVLTLCLPQESSAIPAFARMYGLRCGTCHSAYPALNDVGEQFRLSGFRRFGGGAVPFKVEPVKIGDRLTLPGTLPLSFSITAGYNHTVVDNTLGDGSRNVDLSQPPAFRRRQTSFNLNEFKLLVGTPMGEHLSFFLDAPLGDTEIRQYFDPEVREKGASFKTEGPEVPYLAFVGFHDIFAQDLVNLKGGVIELPTAFSPSIHRLSFSPYLVYEATALDVISRKGIDDIVSASGVDEEGLESNQFRLSKGQIGVQLFGRVPPSVHTIPNLYLDYVVGGVNGNNINSDNNNAKDIFGRLGLTYQVPSATLAVGGFGYYSDNALDSLAVNPDTGAGFTNRLLRYGPDFRFTLNTPVYVNLFSQILFGKDSNPTGFGVESTWWGGFVEAEVKPLEDLIVYSRYDWIDGDKFDDTGATSTGPGGTVSGSIGQVDPQLWDVVLGVQYFLYDNFKLIAEYRHGVKDLGGVPVDPEQLRKTVEDAGFAGIRLVF